MRLANCRAGGAIGADWRVPVGVESAFAGGQHAPAVQPWTGRRETRAARSSLGSHGSPRLSDGQNKATTVTNIMNVAVLYPDMDGWENLRWDEWRGGG